MRDATAEPIEASTTFCIDLDHPALPGHFPGAPVVPGVLLLAEGLHRLEVLTGAPLVCQRIESAKFLQTVAPGAAITAILAMTDSGRARVEFYVSGTLVAHVVLITAAGVANHGHG